MAFPLAFTGSRVGKATIITWCHVDYTYSREQFRAQTSYYNNNESVYSHS